MEEVKRKLELRKSNCKVIIDFIKLKKSIDNGECEDEIIKSIMNIHNNTKDK